MTSTDRQPAARAFPARRQRVLRRGGIRAGQEPRLPHQRDWRRRTVSAQRLVQRILGNIEAYLACCQLGITMASLGLGWVGEPTVSALLHPVLIPLGMPEAALHFTSFMVGFLVFSSLHIVVGEQVPKTLAIRAAGAGLAVDRVSAACDLHPALSAELAAQLRIAHDPASARRPGGVVQHEILTDAEIEGLVEASRPSTARWTRARPSTSTTSSGSASSRSPT